VIADANTAIPGGAGNYTFFGPPAISGGLVAFEGLGFLSQDAIYLSQPNSLSRIIAVGDVLDGKTISGLTFSNFGLDANSLAFGVSFTDGSSAVYKAMVPEPSALVLSLTILALAAGAGVVRRRPAAPPA
jgi:hypothetical protein